jgi:anti-anti-sigma factor
MADQVSLKSKFLLVIANGQEVPIPSSGLTIGRQVDNHVVLPDPLVSRRHADLYFRDGRLYITDLQSANGTCVNGERLAGERALSDGDTLQVGTAELSIKVQSRPISIILQADPPVPDPSGRDGSPATVSAIAAHTVQTEQSTSEPRPKLVMHASEAHSQSGGVGARLDLQGVLDIETVELFREEVGRLLEAQVTHFTLELHSLDYIDSSGLAALVVLHRQVASRSGIIRLQNPQPLVRDIIELTRLDRIFVMN